MSTTQSKPRTRSRRSTIYTELASTYSTTPNLTAKLAIMPTMVKDVLTGRWGKHTNARSTLLLVFGAIAYLLSPIDILPEVFLLIPGLLDDAAIAFFATSRLLSTTEQYMAENGFHDHPIRVQATRL